MSNGPSLAVRISQLPVVQHLLPGSVRPKPLSAQEVHAVKVLAHRDIFEHPKRPPPGIWVNHVWHPARRLANVMPGDIGFYYKKKGQGLKQRLINFGENFVNMSQSGYRGDASVLHAYIVLQAFPSHNRLWVADAAGGTGEPGTGLGCQAIFLDFTGRDKDMFDVDSYHLYYRFKDPRLSEAVVRRAQAWTSHEVANFTWATSSPLRVKYLLPYGRRRVRHLLTHSPFTGPVPRLGARPGENKPYKVMCSEFVASVYIPEIINLFCEDQKLYDPLTGFAMGGLKHGAAGTVFHCDPRYLVPSALQGRLARSDMVERVGCVPPAFVTE